MPVTLAPSNKAAIHQAILDVATLGQSTYTYGYSQLHRFPKTTELKGKTPPYFVVRSGIKVGYVGPDNQVVSGPTFARGMNWIRPVYDFECYSIWPYDPDVDHDPDADNANDVQLTNFTLNPPLITAASPAGACDYQSPYGDRTLQMSELHKDGTIGELQWVVGYFVVQARDERLIIKT